MKAEIHSIMNPECRTAAQLGKRHDSCSLSPYATKVLMHQSLAPLVQGATSFFKCSFNCI